MIDTDDAVPYAYLVEVESRSGFCSKAECHADHPGAVPVFTHPLKSVAQLTDGDINGITLDLLGKWPSFEAQSWACKVVHAVLKYTALQTPVVLPEGFHPDGDIDCELVINLSDAIAAIEAAGGTVADV